MSKREQILEVVRRAQRIQSDILMEVKPCSLHIDTSFCNSLLGHRPKDDLYSLSITFYYAGPTVDFQYGFDDTEMEDCTAALDKIEQISNLL